VRLVPVILVLSAVTANADAPPPAQRAAAPATSRRLTTLDGLRQFSSFYHLQNVLLRGEIVDSGSRLVLSADGSDMRVVLADGVRAGSGPVEVRGQLVDVGRLEFGDPRAGAAEEREPDRWPRPGEELFIRITAVAEAPSGASPSIRALALEPWRFEGQKVTVTGNFRGRNLFGDLPGAPGKSRYDFVLRGAEGAIWVSGIRPRGRGFDLDVDRRVDSDRWLEVSGTVQHERGLVVLDGGTITLAEAPDVTAPPEEPDTPPVPLTPVEVVFSSPTEGEIDVSPATPVRIQFSRGLDEQSLAGQVRVSYVGPAEPGAVTSTLEVKLSYDAANRAIELRFSQPLQPFRTIRVEILEGLAGFDGAPVVPWSLTFSVGG
jgi:hypothetical protein